MGYKVYTDKWIQSNSDEILVRLSNWNLIEEYPGTTKDKVYIGLCDSSGELVRATRTIGDSSSTSVKFININPNKDYYIYFEVPTNSNRYSFNGAISN